MLSMQNELHQYKLALPQRTYDLHVLRLQPLGGGNGAGCFGILAGRG